AHGVLIQGDANATLDNVTIENVERFGIYAPSSITGTYALSNVTVKNAKDYGVHLSGQGDYTVNNLNLIDNRYGGYWNPRDGKGTIHNFGVTGETKEESSLFVEGEIPFDTTFSDDVVVRNTLTVGADATLTLLPGKSVYGLSRASRL
ncbi:hypothetical protein RJ41_14380, partial [Alteromonas marina]